MAKKSNNPIFSENNADFYFAFHLKHILTLTAMGLQNLDQYLSNFQTRLIDFLTCLINSKDERFCYDLRFITHPDPNLYTRGTISIYLLCRLNNSSIEHAKNYMLEFANLLKSLFTEYAFVLVNADKIPKILKPFEVKHLAGITRRVGIERLDSLRRSNNCLRLGFTNNQPPSVANNLTSSRSDTILHIFPYLPTKNPMNGLFHHLLLLNNPVAISVRIKPTCLTEQEEDFFEEQIIRCERYAQIHLGQLSEDASSLWPALKEQATLFQQYQTRMLLGLKDNSALMTLEVASPAPIPVTLLDTLGSVITEPAGGSKITFETIPKIHLAGGYDIINLDSNAAAKENFTKIELTLTSHPLISDNNRRILYLFDSVEAATIFRLPPATLEAPLGLNVHYWRAYPSPRNLPETGCLIGITEQSGVCQQVRILSADRSRHLYVVGQTGTGKTTLLKTMILDDIYNGHGLCVIDPHGDLFKELLGKIPKTRIDDVVVLDPTDTEFPIGLNMLEYEDDSQRHFLIQELVSIIIRLLEDEFGPQAYEMIGPIFLQHMKMNLLLVMSKPNDPGTLLEFYNIYQSRNYWRRWLPLQIKDPLLENWVNQTLPNTDYLRTSSDSISTGSYVNSKFEGFVFDPILRNIFGQKHSTINLKDIMNQGKILLVNLAKGELTETNSRFLGMVLLAKIMAAATSRVKIPPKERKEFYLYVDEFQSIATQNFITLLSEARKFGVSLILANQFLSQIKDPRIIQSIFGNVGTIICFRLGQADAELMEREFFPIFNRFDLGNLPNWQAYIKTLINGQTVTPFNLQTVLDKLRYCEVTAQQVREHSRKTYGKLRKQVEQEIEQSLSSNSEVNDKAEY
ncbi:MAG: type IV secretion system DNA-binding domain-containing protein [candidate division WOR-3 bacterium]